MKLYDHYHKFHPPFMSRCTELILLRYSDLLEVRSGTLIQLLLSFQQPFYRKLLSEKISTFRQSKFAP